MCEHYHHPDRFRANLNATIQALRNITFILQKEKSRIPGFDKWYETIRERLANDPILRWLHQARNLIVKEGELAVTSTGKVTVMNWQKLAIMSMEVPPMMSAGRIAFHIKTTQQAFLAKFKEHEAILQVERQWSVPDIPDKDLVDVLAYGYGRLEEVVKEAHKLCGHGMEIVRVPDMRVIGGQRLPCMEESQKFRIAHLNLKDGTPISFSRKQIQLDPRLVGRAAKRYGLSMIESLGSKAKDPFELAERLVEVAKKMLVKDKTHVPIVFLITPTAIHHVVCPVPDQESKYVVSQEIAKEVRRLKADAVIFINEVWHLPMEKYTGKRPSLSKGRGEGLAVCVASSDGQVKLHMTSFSRNWLGRIKLEPTGVVQGVQFNYLKPIREVWGLTD